MGASASHHILANAEQYNLSDEDRFFGLVNYGNTCYCNSVLQALYFCEPFRSAVLKHRCVDLDANQHADAHGAMPAKRRRAPPTLLAALANLFYEVSTQRQRAGVVAPRSFVKKLRQCNEFFRSAEQQDAHELLNFMLNEIADEMEKETRGSKRAEARRGDSGNGGDNDNDNEDGGDDDKQAAAATPKSRVHELFEGVLTNETRCLTCESVTSRDETFFDLSLDVENCSSITHCLRNFSRTEMMARRDKFFCERCNCLQEAQKRMLVKSVPPCLIVHLKRFKYMEEYGCHAKLGYRVAFPFELRTVDADAVTHELYAIVVHMGSGPNSGHYVCFIKCGVNWLLFDDEHIELVDYNDIGAAYGSADTLQSTSSTAYILFYRRLDDRQDEDNKPKRGRRVSKSDKAEQRERDAHQHDDDRGAP